MTLKALRGPAIALFTLVVHPESTSAQAAVTPAEARSIARDAYVYGSRWWTVTGFNTPTSWITKDPEYKGAWNQLHSSPRVFTPEDKAIQTPNSDTPYSMIGMDLRAEPIVLTVPAIEKEPLLTASSSSTPTRTTSTTSAAARPATKAAVFLIAGPNWKGEAPQGVKKVIRSETELVLAPIARSSSTPATSKTSRRSRPATRRRRSRRFSVNQRPRRARRSTSSSRSISEAEVVAGVLQRPEFRPEVRPTVPSETDLMARFAKIGVGAGKTFDASGLSPEVQDSDRAGHGRRLGRIWRTLQKRIDAKEVTSGEMFGTREFLKNNYLYRMAAAVLGIYGNSKQEAMYPVYAVDADGQKLDGSNRYTLRFAPGQLPPVNAFWSLTMYEMPSSLLVANPINRYLINSPMLPIN